MVTGAQQIDRLTSWKRQSLPRSLPQIDGWEWAVYCSENRWPGGDYFDVLAVNTKQWLVFLGDASGHAGAAAVLSAMGRMQEVANSPCMSLGIDGEPITDPLFGQQEARLG